MNNEQRMTNKRKKQVRIEEGKEELRANNDEGRAT